MMIIIIKLQIYGKKALDAFLSVELIARDSIFPLFVSYAVIQVQCHGRVIRRLHARTLNSG